MTKRLGNYFNLGYDNTEGLPDLSEKQWNILEAALKVFTEKGYSATTTSEIAQVAGVAEGTIFRHFQKKKDILLALLVPLLHGLVGPNAVSSLNELIIENQDKPVQEILVLILKDRYNLFVKNQALLRLVITESQYHPELKETLTREVIYKSQESFVKFLELKKRQGEIRQDVDTWTLVRSLIGMLILFILSQSYFPDREIGKQPDEEIETIVEVFLNGAR